ncbi:hypothetical protein G6F37_011285 [Rhizopus arrhizus]|nr:hypothetical protein G6F38_011346 [Rhizopus arrhizus]KAG1150078.1 hypothetical protein G6F37_011285 [Rhizopus arrhizus]
MKSTPEILNEIFPPSLTAHWFHAIDSPIVDPIAERKKKRFGIEIQQRVQAKCWVPFSKRDNAALEKAYQTNNSIVPVNEDYLFEVDISKREIRPVYWEGPIFEVRRAIWFTQMDGSWVPCEEKMSKQIEEGYLKHKPYQKPVVKSVEEIDITEAANGNDESSNKLVKKPEVEEYIEEKEYLLGPYLGQYVVYTSPTHAWLLYDTTGANIAKNLLEKLTNHQILGGKRLIRGYGEVTKETKKQNEAKKDKKSEATKEDEEKDKEIEQEQYENVKDPKKRKELSDKKMIEQEAEDYENEESEEDVRCVDHLVFVIHGIGQRMSERLGQNFVHDVNLLRKTMKSTWPIALSGVKSLDRSNGIQVLPILWRNSIAFGADAEEDNGSESDLGLSSENLDDGCPTIDEITLDGAPNIRTLVSDVFLDIPLYLTKKHHDQMIQVITREVNRVYNLFLERNPSFSKNNGQVSILGHSLGSLLAFDILSVQPFAPNQKPDPETTAVLTEKKPLITFDFPVKNFFAVGSPLGMILLLRSYKIVSRKALTTNTAPNHVNTSSSNKTPSSLVSFVYPAADNIYNIFHKSDPVAYRLEPLVVRHYGAKLKPVPIPYIKGGLKSVLDAGFIVGNDIASKAGAIFESFKSGITSSLLMRGLGLSKVSEEKQVAELKQRSQSNPEIMAYKAEVKSAAKLGMLNPTGRIDFCLQEGLLENAYISALSVHMSYWQDVDVAGFLIREIYKKEEPIGNLVHSKTAYT